VDKSLIFLRGVSPTGFEVKLLEFLPKKHSLKKLFNKKQKFYDKTEFFSTFFLLVKKIIISLPSPKRWVCNNNSEIN
jgi:hypothetical protein